MSSADQGYRPFWRLWGAVLAFLALCAAASPAHSQGIIRDAEIEDTLRAFTDPVLEAAGIDPDDVSVVIVSDPVPNAFVARGQNIFLHTGLIMASQTPNELIGVIAHETGHIAGGHLARSREAMREARTPALIAIGVGILAIAAGAPEAGVAAIAGAPQFAQGSFVQHTQVQESAADQAAVTFLDATGQSSRGLISFFERQFRPNEFITRRIPPYMMTHPFTSDRVQALRERVEASPFADAPERPEHLDRFAMMQAKLAGFLNPVGEVEVRYPPSDASLPARYARAIAAYRIPDLARARREIQTLIDDHPDNPFFNELMGQVLFENGQAEASIPFHERALILAPDQPLLQINLARALLDARGSDGAADAELVLRAAVQREPDNGLGWRELARAYDLQGQDGMARLASAEQYYAGGALELALNFAERARQALPRQSAAWRRADDIIAFTQNRMQQAAARN